MNTKSNEKLHDVFCDIIDNDLVVGMAKGTDNQTLVIAISTTDKAIIKTISYDLTDITMDGIITSMNILKNEVLHVSTRKHNSKPT